MRFNGVLCLILHVHREELEGRFSHRNINSIEDLRLVHPRIHGTTALFPCGLIAIFAPVVHCRRVSNTRFLQVA